MVHNLALTRFLEGAQEIIDKEINSDFPYRYFFQAIAIDGNQVRICQALRTHHGNPVSGGKAWAFVDLGSGNVYPAETWERRSFMAKSNIHRDNCLDSVGSTFGLPFCQ